MSPDQHPWLGLALASLIGIALRDKGPILWIATALALCYTRRFQLDWTHLGALVLFVCVMTFREGIVGVVARRFKLRL